MSIAVMLAGLFSGILGAMGLGGGAVLIIYLSVFTDCEQLSAQGINLIFFIPIGLAAVIIYSFQKKIKWRVVIPVALSGLAGAVPGLLLAGSFGGELTSKLFGGLLIVIGLSELFSRGKKDK